MTATEKPLPHEEKLREEAYLLNRRFSDVLELIRYKQDTTRDPNHCVEYQGPIMFLADSLAEFEGFLLELNGYIDRTAGDFAGTPLLNSVKSSQTASSDSGL